MGSTVDDIHHRNRKHVAVGSTDVAVERNVKVVGGGVSDSEGNTEDGVCAEVALGGGAVEFDHSLIDSPLLKAGHSDDFWSDLLVDVGDSLENALSAVALRVTVTKLKSLVLAC